VLDLFYRGFSWPIIPATSIAFLVAFFVSFSLQKFWTFRDKSRDRISKQLLGYLANGLVGLYLNGWLMKLLVEDYALWHLLAQILVSAVIALQNFLVYRIIFKKNHEDSGQ
jgi:putative flippase GtrA